MYVNASVGWYNKKLFLSESYYAIGINELYLYILLHLKISRG